MNELAALFVFILFFVFVSVTTKNAYESRFEDACCSCGGTESP